MFVSRPPYEFPVPDQLRGPDERYWRALAMPTNLPWYIATLESLVRGKTYVNSMCFCWETDLLDAVRGAPATVLVSLQMVRPPRAKEPAWSMRPIARIWRLIDGARSDDPYLVFEDVDGVCLCPLSGAELACDLSEREVAAEVRHRH
jgi:hypothetical protein